MKRSGTKVVLKRMVRRGLVTYHVNCDCCSYNWTRRPMRGAFLRCKGCGRLVGDMDVSIVTPNAAGQTPAAHKETT